MGVPPISLPNIPLPAGQDEGLREGILDLARRITDKYNRAYWRSCADEKREPHELTLALGECGLLGLGVPAEFGGMGGGMVDQVLLVEALARQGIPSYTFMIANFARNLIIKHGNAEQIGRFVPATVAGKERTCFALTEANTGTNTFAMRTKAEPVEGGWLVNGEKVYISAAGESSQMLLVARTGAYSKETKSSGLSLFIADPKAKGVTMAPLNIRVNAPEVQYIVHFDNVFVPAENLVGEPGDGVRYLFGALNPERILIAAMAIGLGFFAINKALEYAATRAPFGAAIGTYQAVQHPLARAYIQLEAARLMTYEAAAAVDRGDKAGQASNAAKWLASEAANAAVDAAIQTHGGAAFDRDYDVITLYEPLRLLRIAPIANDLVLSYTAEHTLGMPRAH